MAKQSIFYFFTAVLAMLLLVLVLSFGGFSLLRSSPPAGSGGISAVAGGVSQGLFSLAVVVAVFLVVLGVVVTRILKRR